MKNAIAYYRVSTVGQGQSGLGLEAQQEAVTRWASTNGYDVVASYTEVESGKRNTRPELERAQRHARKSKATLVVAKLDRLARNARFLLGILESGLDVAFCDLPHVPIGAMGRFLVSTMASVAEMEAGLISERTKAALAAYKARGGTLGGSRPNSAKISADASCEGGRASGARRRSDALEHDSEVWPMIRDARSEGLSLRGIAERLNMSGETTSKGASWNASQVKRVIDRSKER